MKKIIPLSISALLLSSFISSAANAEPDMTDDGLKHISVGVGTYALTISDDNNRYVDDELSGYSFAASYAFNDNLAVKGQYFSQEHDSFSFIESTGYDLVGYFGTGLATNGFKAYIGGGLYNDNWSANGFKEDFSGLQLNGGVGYNWDVISVDLVIGIRESADYKNFVEDSLFDPTVVSSSLLVSVRF